MFATISLYIINYPQNNIKWKIKKMWINVLGGELQTCIFNINYEFIHTGVKMVWIMCIILTT